MQKLGVTVRIVFSPLCTHTSESRHSSLYKCTLRSSPDKRNTVSHLPSARILWQGATMGKAKTHTRNEIGDSLRVCELERDEFQVQWLPILCTEQQYRSTTVSTSGWVGTETWIEGQGQRRRDKDRDGGTRTETEGQGQGLGQVGCGRTCDLFPLKGCIWVTMNSIQV